MLNVNTKGVTLIELLIVVAIIGILASIAMVNFLQAQMRAKVVVAYNDMRVIALALELYRVDHNHYIKHKDSPDEMYQLTTPTDYLSSPPDDPFAKQKPGWYGLHYHMEDLRDLTSWAQWPWVEDKINHGRKYLLWSIGPDLKHEFHTNAAEYDPTNGTISVGDLTRIGP